MVGGGDPLAHPPPTRTAYGRALGRLRPIRRPPQTSTQIYAHALFYVCADSVLRAIDAA